MTKQSVHVSEVAAGGRMRCALARLACVGLSVGMSVALAANELPDLGGTAASALSPRAERELGTATMTRLRAAGGVLDDPEINAYLNSLGSRLLATGLGGDQAFQFFAVGSSEINAFALPGGFIGINTKLIETAETESELASVLAHEISHVTQRHIARQLEAQSGAALTTVAALAAAIVAAKSGNGEVASAAMTGAMAGQMQQQINYTRENEREADRVGFQMLERAGFDTRAMASFFQRLQDASHSQDNQLYGYLMTHPLTGERIAEAQNRSLGKPATAYRDSFDFHLVRALLLSYRGKPEEAVKRFRDALEQPGQGRNRDATRYGLAAALLRAREWGQASAEIDKLDRAGVRHPMIESLAAQILQQSGQYAAALKRYRSALADYPDHLQLVYDYPRTLMLDKQPTQAAQFIERQLARRGDDPTLHQLAAEAYDALGQRTRSHLHQGKYYALVGQLRLAMEQFQIAINADDGGVTSRQVAEHRLSETRENYKKFERELEARGERLPVLGHAAAHR